MPAQPLPSTRTGSSSGVLIPILVTAAGVLSLVGALGAYLGLRGAREPVVAPTTKATLEPAAPKALPEPPAPEAAAAARYPLRSLLGVSTAVDIDGSKSHMLGLFPSIASGRHGDELRYVVPLDHPWFSEAELGWKNERAGKLTSVSFRPPDGVDKFENQPEIGDCLAKGLGKGEVRETDHLAGEKSYFWGRHFPKAWANLYSSYLWLTFQNPQGIAPITLGEVVRTLDGCTPKTP